MQGGSASSGKHERRRIDGDHRRRSRTKTMAWRRCRASRGAWLGGEEEGVEAELLSSAEGRGVAGGYVCDGGALRWLSVVLQIERGREPERAERGIAVGDDSVASLEARGGSRRWPGEAGGGRGGIGARHRAASGRGGGRRQRGGGGLGRPAQMGRQVARMPGKWLGFSLLFFCSVLFF